MAKKYFPLLLLLGFALVAFVVYTNPPTVARGRPAVSPQLAVEVQTLSPSPIAIKIQSYGSVKPRTQSVLLPQVSGQIIEINPNFRDGGFFEQGEVLLSLDQRDYRAEIDIARASLFTAQQALSEEQARVEQARQDWQRLGNEDVAPDLVLRKPQLQAAQAKVYSAQASLAKAELALERTKIVAPYTGRILAKHVDVGQVVSSGTKLADIYAVDYIEVRLPIKNKDLPYIQLPEANRFQQSKDVIQPDVQLTSALAGYQSWPGKVVRTEGAFDQNSQQLFVVAQIDDPYGVNSQQGLPIKIGQYVTAIIDGKVIQDAITVPNRAIYQGSYVYVVNEQGVLQRKNIEIAWQNDKFAMIESGLTAGQQLVLTPLGQVNSGTPVEISIKDGEAVDVLSKSPKADKQIAKTSKQQETNL